MYSVHYNDTGAYIGTFIQTLMRSDDSVMVIAAQCDGTLISVHYSAVILRAIPLSSIDVSPVCA